MKRRDTVQWPTIRRGWGCLLAVALFGVACAEEEPEPEVAAVPAAAPAVAPAAPEGEVFPPPDLGPGEIAARLVEWDVELSQDTVDAGPATFRVRNAGTMPHALEVEGQGIEQETEHLQPGATATLTVDLQPGRYTVYCPVEGQVTHRTEGMVTTLYVREASP